MVPNAENVTLQTSIQKPSPNCKSFHASRSITNSLQISLEIVKNWRSVTHAGLHLTMDQISWSCVFQVESLESRKQEQRPQAFETTWDLGWSLPASEGGAAATVVAQQRKRLGLGCFTGYLAWWKNRGLRNHLGLEKNMMIDDSWKLYIIIL